MRWAVLTIGVWAAALGAAAQPLDCADPAGTCGGAIAPSCLNRIGAGSVSIGAADLCAAQFDAYRACIAQAAAQCGAVSGPRCAPEDARGLFAFAAETNTCRAYDEFLRACPEAVQVGMAESARERLRCGDGAAPPRETASPAAAPALSPSEVRDAQAALHRLGFAVGTVDGVWGRRSTEALRAFERGAGLAATGVLTQDLLARLRAAPTPAVAGPCEASDPYGAFDPQERLAACSQVIASGRLSAADRALSHYGRGRAHARLQAWRAALADFDAAIRLDPTLSLAYVNRGVTHNRLNDPRRGVADLSVALELDPTSVIALRNRCFAYAKLGDAARAVADCDAAVRLEPGSSRVYNTRGTMYETLGQPERALAEYDAALRLDPDRADIYFNRASANERLGRLERALADYDAAIRLDPDHARAFNNRGLLRAGLGDRRSAIADYDAAIRADPDYASAFFNRANAYFRLNDHRRAIADYGAAIRLRPDDAEAYENRAVVHNALGDAVAAARDRARAAALR